MLAESKPDGAGVLEPQLGPGGVQPIAPLGPGGIQPLAPLGPGSIQPLLPPIGPGKK